MKIKKLKKVIINENKWLRGSKFSKRPRLRETNSILDSCLLDHNGFMCCLGQWSEQAGVPRELLKDSEQPEVIGLHIPLLTDENGVNTDFAQDMMTLNDECTMRISEKKKKLIALAKKEGVTLIFQ